MARLQSQFQPLNAKVNHKSDVSQTDRQTDNINPAKN